MFIYDQAIALNRDDFKTYNNCGFAYKAKHDNKQAIVDFQQSRWLTLSSKNTSLQVLAEQQ